MRGLRPTTLFEIVRMHVALVPFACCAAQLMLAALTAVSGLCRSLLRVPPAHRVVDAHNGAWLRVASDTLFRICGLLRMR